MAGQKKTKEKEQRIRTEIQQKSKMTREELGGQLLKGVRAEQLDTTTKDALSAKNRLTRLSNLGATKALDLGMLKQSNVVGQMPKAWEKLLGAEFTVEEWKLMQRSVDDLLEGTGACSSPKILLNMNEPKLKHDFFKRCYEDEDTMKLIAEAYVRGATDAYHMVGSQGPQSITKKVKELVEVQKRIIEFLIEDYTEAINPILSLTPRELVDRVTLYFVECDLTKRFYTVPGLVFYIGFATREEFFDYMKEHGDSIHAYILKRAMTYIEAERVTDMLYGGGLMAGHKIDLATNFNYNDAGKKGESPSSQTNNITVNNNTLSMETAPPRPVSLEDWQKQYNLNAMAKKQDAQEAIEAEKANNCIEIIPQQPDAE